MSALATPPLFFCGTSKWGFRLHLPVVLVGNLADAKHYRQGAYDPSQSIAEDIWLVRMELDPKSLRTETELEGLVKKLGKPTDSPVMMALDKDVMTAWERDVTGIRLRDGKIVVFDSHSLDPRGNMPSWVFK